MNITRNEIEQFRMDFASAVQELEKQYQVKVHLGNIKYSDSSFRAPIFYQYYLSMLIPNS